MKKILLLSILIFGLLNLYSQTQIILTFTAKDSISQNTIILDSVYVKNLTQNCDTLLYGPAPILTLLADWPVGIGKTDGNSSGSFILKQNYPNPFQGSTLVNIYREYQGILNLMLFDELGTKLAEYHNGFEKGFHSFMISSSVNKVLFLAVSDAKNYRSIKIVSAGQSNEGSMIRYLGQTHSVEKSSSLNPESPGFIFYLGNQMMYTAYASGYHDNTKFDAPVASTAYTFNMILLSNPVIPTVTTAIVTNITQTTATSGGDVTSDGGATVMVRGVCWSTSSNPTTANNHTTDGSGTGTFVSNLTGLTANTLYYVRAYATNSVGTAYGNELTFTTLSNPVLPTVTTTSVTNITQTTATSGGNVTSDGGATVTARGVCWNTSSNPTTANNHTTDGSGTGTFVSSLTGLTANTLYYVRAYATNSIGTAYGNELTFTTLPNPVLPTVTTTAVTNITQTTASSGGNVTSDGGATVTVRGVCWNTSSGPTTANSHTIDGSGTGTFVSNLTGLNPNTLYYVRAYATNSVGTAYGNEVTFTTLTVSMPTVTTATVTNIGQTTATSGGTVTSDGGASVMARGVCWNTSSNPTTANNHTTDGSGTGTFVSNLTGLTANTLYYVRAYATNTMGTAYGNEVSFTTQGAWSCGSPITINHLVSGGVAPVDKTATYGTVTGIPGETSKCWITSNLGADHQATAKDDATEPSAGWYWQFNRMQGYKHDGTTRTPNTTWITPIDENLDWQAANDPCALEMGNGWRLPTYTEWFNVDASGNWTDWNGPWNSGLKLHAAGYLSVSDGSLTSRGIWGEYWSSTQYSTAKGWALDFSSGVSYTGNLLKAIGCSLRCIKD